LASLAVDPGWNELRRYPYCRAYEVASGQTVFLFRFGALVCDGARRISTELRSEVQRVAYRRLLPATEDTYFIAIDPGCSGARVGWDRVVIPERHADLVAAVALLLAQSVALERYENTADSLLEQTLVLSRDLAQRGRLPRGIRGLVERVGRLTGDRLELARWFFLVDRPEATWQDARVAQLYDVLFANLELQQRHQAMLHKLEAVEAATQAALDMWHGRRANALEWAIVWLIVVEIVFGVLGVV